MSLDPTKFEIYAVGGYVRDRLLGRDPKDHDYVVVGATAEDMINAGFEPIEASFPVFLHPVSRDEYALARKERKVGVGYHGFEVFFDPTVTIEDDLYRRDLTVNAMARRVIGWSSEGFAKLSDEIVDPFNGQQDLKDGMLRHVSEAFAEDPVRVLRTARFSARYGFDVHPDTVTLMGKVAPELNHIPQERIWAEFEKGLMEQFPWLMFELLEQCGAMTTTSLVPYAGANTGVMTQFVDDTPLHARFVIAARQFMPEDYDTCRIPTELARVSKAFNTNVCMLWAYDEFEAPERLTALEAMRAINDDTLLVKCVDALMLFHEMRDMISNVMLMGRDLKRIRSVDAAAIAATCKNGLEIKQKLFEARVAAM